MRIHAIPHSTNVQRVALALGLKGVRDVEWVQHAPGDRAAVRALSGQDLVPVVETGDGRVLTDSMPIVEWIDATWPDGPALYPADPAIRRQVDAFVTFFNHVWKVPPNAIDAERQGAAQPDTAKIAAWSAQTRAWQHGFEALLTDRPFLFGDEPSAADICAYPFLKFTTSTDPDDDDLFHGILLELLPGDFPNLAAWIARMARLPQA